jgi:hypothetical protein
MIILFYILIIHFFIYLIINFISLLIIPVTKEHFYYIIKMKMNIVYIFCPVHFLIEIYME